MSTLLDLVYPELSGLPVKLSGLVLSYARTQALHALSWAGGAGWGSDPWERVTLEARTHQAAAEIAVAVTARLMWDPTPRRRFAPTFGNLYVQWGDQLLLTPAMVARHPGVACVLVGGTGPTYYIRGWIKAYDATVRGGFGQAVQGAAYMVEPAQLGRFMPVISGVDARACEVDGDAWDRMIAAGRPKLPSWAASSVFDPQPSTMFPGANVVQARITGFDETTDTSSPSAPGTTSTGRRGKRSTQGGAVSRSGTARKPRSSSGSKRPSNGPGS